MCLCFSSDDVTSCHVLILCLPKGLLVFPTEESASVFPFFCLLMDYCYWCVCPDMECDSVCLWLQINGARRFLWTWWTSGCWTQVSSSSRSRARARLTFGGSLMMGVSVKHVQTYNWPFAMITVFCCHVRQATHFHAVGGVFLNPKPLWLPAKAKFPLSVSGS